MFASLSAWSFIFIQHGHNVQREHEAHTGNAWYEPHLISLQVFHDTEHNLHQLGTEPLSLSFSLFFFLSLPPPLTQNNQHNKWQKMMSNNYVLQGQKYTNGVGALPPGMMGSPSDIWPLQMARCTLSSVSSWTVLVNCFCAIVWLSQAFVRLQRRCYTSRTTRRRRQSCFWDDYVSALCKFFLFIL